MNKYIIASGVVISSFILFEIYARICEAEKSKIYIKNSDNVVLYYLKCIVSSKE